MSASPTSSTPPPRGATPVGPPTPARRKWLVPLLIGLALLIALVLLLSRCGNDDDPSATGAASSPSAATAPSALTTPSAAATSAATAASGQPGAQQATVTAGGDDLLGAGTDLSGYAGEQATGNAVQVQSVPADEGFWVGTSATDRVWVQLTGTRGESDYRVKQGDAINFTGTVNPAEQGFADKVGLTAAEGADQLTEQGHYLSVPSSSVQLSR